MLGVLCIMFITSREKKTKQQHSSFKEGKPNSQMTPKKKEKKKNEWRERERNGSLHFLLLLLCVLKKKNVYERKEALTQSFVNDTQHRQSISKLIRKVSDDTSAAITITTRPSSPSLYFFYWISSFFSPFSSSSSFWCVYPHFLASISSTTDSRSLYSVMMYTSSIMQHCIQHISESSWRNRWVACARWKGG